MEQPRASIARMIARTHSATLLGVNAVEVEIEYNEADGNQFRCTIVGLPDLAVKEARDRVLAAVRNSGFFAPTSGYLTFNLAPADLPKQGPAFDLPLAVTLEARAKGRKQLIVPRRVAAEASVVQGIQIIGVENLRDAVHYLKGEKAI